MSVGGFSLDGGFGSADFAYLEELIKKAGEIGIRMQRNIVPSSKSNIFDLVTEGDVAIQDLLTCELQYRFGSIPLVAEEQKDPRINSDDFFVLDPIDGTSVYASGGEDWGIQFAYFKGGVPEAGIIYLPRRELLVSVIRSQGVLCNGTTLERFSARPLARSIVGAEIGFFIPDQHMPFLFEIRNHCLGLRNLFSASANGVDLVRGLLGAYISLGGGKVWDFAATALAVQELGGSACNTAGQSLTWKEIPQTVLFGRDQGIIKELLAIRR